jgi:drug/metabolite transporter (DMT)-like permease
MIKRARLLAGEYGRTWTSVSPLLILMLFALRPRYPGKLTQTSRATNRLLLFLAAFLFSTGGAAIKMTALTAWQVAGFRSGIAAVVILIAIPGARRNWTWQTLAVGVSYALTLVLFVIANKITTSANAIFLQSTAPLYLLFIGPWLLHESVQRIDLVVFAAIAAGAGLLLFGSAGQSSVPNSRTGDLLAAVSGFTWAWTLAGLRWLGKRDPAGTSATSTVIAGNLIAFLVCLPFALPFPHASVRDIGVVFYLGIFQVALAYVFLTRSIRHVPALEAAVLLLVEPVFNPLWSWLFCAEMSTTSALCGGAVIISAAFLRTWWQTRIRN